MPRLPRIFLGVILLLILSVNAVNAELVLQYNRWLPPGYFIDAKIFEPWFKKVQEVTEGRVKIIPTTSSLGPPQRQFDLARTGVADVAWGTEGLTPGRFPLTEIMDIPFLSDSTGAAAVAYWQVYKKYFEVIGEHKMVKVITLFCMPPGQIYTRKGPITSLEALKGLKLRTMGTNITKIAQALGAVGVPAPTSELYEIVSRGVVDGVFFTDASFVSRRLYDHLPYKTHIPGGLYLGSGFLVMNQNKWNAISPADQKAIMEISGEKLSRIFGRVEDEEIAKAQEFMKSHGVKVNNAGGDFLKELHTKLGFIEDGWLAKAKEKGVDGREALQFLRGKIANYKP